MRLKFQNKIDEIQVDINFYSIIDKVLFRIRYARKIRRLVKRIPFHTPTAVDLLKVGIIKSKLEIRRTLSIN